MADVSPTKWHRGPHHLVLRDVPPPAPPRRATTRTTPTSGTSSTRTTRRSVPVTRGRNAGLIARPTSPRSARYRAHVDAAMQKLIDGCDDDAWPELAALIELGLHHEQQHQELLLMDIKHVLSCNPLDPRYVDAPLGAAPRPHAVRCACSTVDGGLVEVGHAAGPNGFAFDNESPAPHGVPRAVRASPTGSSPRASGSRSSTTAATRGPSSGSPTAGTPCRSTAGDAPSYWQRRRRRLVASSRSTAGGRVDPAEPVVHVSHYEADAFARWCGRPAPDRVRVGARGRDARRLRRARRSAVHRPARRACIPRPRRTDGLAAAVRRRVAVDGERVPAVSALLARARRGR